TGVQTCALPISIVEVQVAAFRRGSDRIHVDDEPVILARDLDSPRDEVLDGLIEAAVPELQLVGARAQGTREELVPQADAEDRLLPQEALHRFDCVAKGSWVSGAAREEDPVWVFLQNLSGRKRSRNGCHVAASTGEAPKDVALGPE